MRFYAIRDIFNVPQIGITVDPKSPGFKHPNHIHRGYRFNFGSSDTYENLTPPEKQVVFLLIDSKGVVVDDGSLESNAAIAKVEADIVADKKRERRDKREPWTRAHKFALAGLLVSTIGAIIGFAGWYHAAHQSPVYQHQIQVKHQAEEISGEIYEFANEFDKDDNNQKVKFNIFYGNKLGYRIEDIVKELGDEGLHTNLLDQTTFGADIIQDGNQLRGYAAAITNLSQQLPNAR